MTRRIAGLVRSVLALSAFLVAVALVNPAAAQPPTNTPTTTGCCLCLNCPGSAGFCTDSRTITQCNDACIIALGCDTIVFGIADTCMMDGSCAGLAPPT